MSAGIAITYRTGYRLYPPAGLCPWHNHPTLELVYHPAGRGYTDARSGGRMPFREGTIIVYPPGEQHNQWNETDGEDWCIHADLALTAPIELWRCLAIPAVTDSAVLAELRTLTDAPPTISPLRRRAYTHRLSALLLLLIEESMSQRHDEAAPADVYVKAACDYIAMHFHMLPRLEVVAEEVGISYDYLRHLFRQATGMRLIDYVTAMRVEKGKELLAHTPLTCKAIAEMCGFDNERYFSTVFRRRVGCTPGAFRRSVADEND